MATLTIHSMMSKIEDVQGDKVNYVEWLAKLGVDVKPGDITGLSTQIFNSHNDEMNKRFTDQLTRLVTLTSKYMYSSVTLVI